GPGRGADVHRQRRRRRIGVLRGGDGVRRPGLLPGAAQFDGTYTMLAAFGSFNSPSSPRTVTVTVNQYEASGGTKWSATTDPVTFTPATQVTNGIVDLGNLTLPPKALAEDNALGYFTVQVTDTNTSDTVLDLLIIDNNGQTVLIN